PFAESTITQKLLAHHTKDPTPIHLLRADVPEAMSDVIRVMMAKDPADRYQTPAEVLEALAPWATPRFAAAPSTIKMRPVAPPTTTTRKAPPAPPKFGASGKTSAMLAALPPSPPANRRRWLLPAVAAGVFVLGVGIFLATRGRSGKPSSEPGQGPG